jgi:cytochrome c oxidase subunit 4
MLMADTHTSPTVKQYLVIGVALAALTAISFVASETSGSKVVTGLVVLGMATVKATLVATFFMHLKWDWVKVRVMLIPAAILAAVLVCALLPDITFALRSGTGWVRPSAPAAASAPVHHAP